jgi:hypothetical protein
MMACITSLQASLATCGWRRICSAAGVPLRSSLLQARAGEEPRVEHATMIHACMSANAAMVYAPAADQHHAA